MFIYIKHGADSNVMFVYLDNNQFLVNTNCPTVLLMKYIKVRLGLAESGTSDGAYTSVTSLLSSVDSALLETLQTQIDNLEKTRLKQLHIVEARTATSEEINAQALSTKTQTKKRKKVTHANPPDEEVQRHTRDRKSRN
ncbi:hypothetical protein H4Q32_020821 [Labeo rohita]|uniref:Uncharacterized protein n=1 Tax=Labeo rohita TaxID=84645 RepID=A0ABQ8M1P9_LABRO|nr:hypothetical protein H4Q32_020821 [Labeo rohita]